MSTPKFPVVPPTFHSELKTRIQQYFANRKKKSTGNFSLFFKAGILTIGYIALYVHLVFFTPPVLWGILECTILGILTAAIGFNVMHDGAHGSFSRFKWVNTMAAFSANFLGASNFMWKTKHNVIHHTYTNIHGVDDDIEAGVLLRLCPDQKFHKIYKYQYLYFWVAYSLLYFWWVFVTDYKKYVSGKIGSIALQKMSVADHIIFWVTKIVHAFVFIVLPILLLGFEMWVVGFLIFGLVAGFVLSIVFQLAHTVTNTQFPHADAHGKMEDEFAVHQLKTTANFATRSKMVSWWLGGLNFQVEHHLFPKVSHVHYPAISKIVKQACKEKGVPYLESPNLFSAVKSHVAFLRQMGKPTIA